MRKRQGFLFFSNCFQFSSQFLLNLFKFSSQLLLNSLSVPFKFISNCFSVSSYFPAPYQKIPTFYPFLPSTVDPKVPYPVILQFLPIASTSYSQFHQISFPNFSHKLLHPSGFFPIHSQFSQMLIWSSLMLLGTQKGLQRLIGAHWDRKELTETY